MEDDTSVFMHLVQCQESEFNKIIDLQSTMELANSISFIQTKIKKEQEEINHIKSLLQSDTHMLDKGSSDTYTTLTTRLNSQNSLIRNLIARSMKCFAKYKEKAEETATGVENTENKMPDSVNFSTSNQIKSESLFEDTMKEPGKISVMDKESGYSIQLQNGYEDIKKIGQKDAKIKSEPSDLKEIPGKTKGHKLIQEFSSRSAVDDIRTEIAKTVDRSAKENVSKFLLKKTAQNSKPVENNFENPDVKGIGGRTEVMKTVDKLPSIDQKLEHEKHSKSEIGNIFQKNNLSTLSNDMAESPVDSDSKQTSSFPHLKFGNSEETNQKNTDPKLITEKSYSGIHTETNNEKTNRISKSDMLSRSKMLENFLKGRTNGSDFNNIQSKKTGQLNETKVKNISEISKERVKTDPKTVVEVSAAAANHNSTSGSETEQDNLYSVPEILCESSEISPVQEMIKRENDVKTFQEVKLNEVNISKENIVKQTNVVESNHDITNEDNKKTENNEGANNSMTNENSVQYKSLKKDAANKAKAEIDALVSPFNTPLPKQDEDMFTEDKQSFNEWDPSALFTDLYNIHLVPDDTKDFSPDFIEMEGVMEKLPMNKKKSTLLKTWKRRYFIAKNGWLVYYDNRGDQQPSDEILLMGGNITIMDNLVIGIDDGRGHYLMVRCPSAKEYEQWLAALQSQTVDNTKANYIQPLVDAPKCYNKNIVIIEMGSISIRAGVLKENVTLPQIFFPSVVAINYSGKKHFVGFEAYKPNNRLSSKLLHLFGLSDKVDKFKIEYEILPSIFTAIFQDLKLKPSEYQVMLVLPLHISKKDKENIMKILMNRFHVQAVCMVTQAITALYSYNTKSGIMVDIGERMEVIPIYDGFAIEGGQSVQSYGAGKIRQSLRSGLAKHNFPLYSPLEQILVRYVMEQTCYVSKNYEEELHKYMNHPEKFFTSVYLNKYNIPNDAFSTISHDISRFASPEGFFNTDLWGMDYPTVQALVLKAIDACPMDNRRHMCRAIYLSGGVTMIPGFAARLEKEVQTLVNPSLLVQVHSSPQRYHAAYIGACILCALPEFQNHCISFNEWKKEGTTAFRKWIY